MHGLAVTLPIWCTSNEWIVIVIVVAKVALAVIVWVKLANTSAKLKLQDF